MVGKNLLQIHFGDKLTDTWVYHDACQSKRRTLLTEFLERNYATMFFANELKHATRWQQSSASVQKTMTAIELDFAS